MNSFNQHQAIWNNVTTVSLGEVYAAWIALLVQYNGRDDGTFLTVFRDVEHAKEYIGAVKIHLTQGISILELIQRVTESVELEKGACKVDETEADCNPLDSALVLVKHKLTEDLSRFRDPKNADRFTICIVIDTLENGVNLDFMCLFDENMIPAIQIARLLRQLDDVLHRMVIRRSSDIRDLLGCGSSDMEEIMRWNSTEPPRFDTTINEAFQNQVARSPDVAAITSSSGSWTYAEVDALSSSAASILYQHGVRNGTVVLACFEKSVLALLGMMGILKAGGVCLFVDPGWPKARMEHSIRLAATQGAQRTPVMLSATKSELSCPPVHDRSAVQLVEIDMSELNDECETAERSTEATLPSQDAFILSTSGSTGTPKGVVLQHSAVVTSAFTQGEAEGVDSKSRVLQFVPFTFDVAIYDIFTTLCRGGCVVVPSNKEKMEHLVQFMNEQRINFAAMTPIVMSTLRPADVPTLKTWVVVGQAATQDDINIWAGHVTMINGYGSTEASTPAPALLQPGSSPNYLGNFVGARSWITISESSGNLLAPIGVIGELIVEGWVMARGYLDNEPQNQDRFMSQEPEWLRKIPGSHGRLYRSGDLAVYNADGTLSYCGRKDGQVKIRGQRIELGDIEYQIKQHMPANTAVVAETFEPPRPVRIKARINEKVVVALICCGWRHKTQPNSQFELLPMTAEMRRTIRRIWKTLELGKLPRHALPTYLIPVSDVPLTSSGKVDRKALRTLLASRGDLQVYSPFYNRRELSNTKPKREKTPTEHRIIPLWAEALVIPENIIAIHDNFFVLGGTSIDVIKLVAFARDVNLPFDVKDVFSNPRLEDLAILVDKNLADKTETQLSRCRPSRYSMVNPAKSLDAILDEACSACSCNRDDIEDVYPATPLQEGLAALTCVHPGAYITQRLFLVKDVSKIHRLTQAWDRTVQATPILRTRIFQCQFEGRPDLGVQDSATFQVYQAVLKPRQNSTTSVCSSYRTLSEHLSERRFEFATSYGSPLSSVELVTLSQSPAEVYFLWTVHHAIYDGWCEDLIFERFQEACNQNSQLPLETISYSEFIHRFLEHERTNTKAVEHWQSILSGNPSTAFPRNTSTLVPCADQVCTYSATLPNRSESDVTISTVIRSAWAILMARYCNTNHVLFGAITTGRTLDLPGITSVVGPTLATVPVVFRIDRSLSISNFLVAAQDQSNQERLHEHMGLTNIERLTGRKCNFMNLLVIQPTESKAIESNCPQDLEIVPIDSVERHPYPLVIEVIVKASDSLAFRVSYDKRVLTERQIARITHQYLHLIIQLISEPDDRTIGQLSLASQTDLGDIKTWSMRPPSPVVDSCIHDILHSHAQKKPDGYAIHAHDAVLTYSELDSLSSSLVPKLRSLGVRSNVLVPLCFEKGAWAVVAQIAVLKAGGAFISVDVRHPEMRTRRILQMVNAKIVLSSLVNEDFVRAAFRLPVVVVSSSAISGLALVPTEAPISSSNDLAYAMCTSGTTGTPKIVMIQHRAICTSALAHGNALGVTSTTRAYQFSSYTFDTSIADILTTLFHGGCVCVASESDRMNRLADSIGELNANFALLTPSVIETISPDQVPGLRTLVSTGEAISSRIVRDWVDRVYLYDSFGPAEASVMCVVARLHASTSPRNIGYGVGCKTWVVDPENTESLAPVGCNGELLLDGEILSKGYLGDEKRTKEVFIEPPNWLRKFRGESRDKNDHRKIYRTGDLVHYNEDGSLTYVGRVNSSEVKLRGQRVSLTEIEQNIEAFFVDDTKAIVEVVSRGDSGQKQLVAFIHSDQEYEGDDEDIIMLRPLDYLESLQSFLAGRVPQSMMPETFLPIRRIPKRNDSAKADRKLLNDLASRLAARDFFNLPCHVSLTPPQTVAEQKLAETWAIVLHVPLETINHSSNFLRLGGNSLLAIRLVSCVRKTLKQTISVSQIFQNPALSEMALQLADCVLSDPEIGPFSLIDTGESQQSLLAEASSQCGVDATLIEDMYPATAQQEAMMALSRDGSNHYRSTSIHRFSSPVTADYLKSWQAAWMSVIRSTPILRTRIFSSLSGSMFQVVLSTEGLTWFCQSTSLSEYVSRDRNVNMVPGSSLCRVGIIADDECQYFVWTISHCLYDGHTLSSLIDMVNTALRNENALLTEPKPFKCYVAYLSRSDRESASKYWDTYLTGAYQAHIATPQTHRNSQSTGAACKIEHDMIFPTSYSAEWTRATILQASWAILLGLYTNSDDVVFGVISSGRELPLSNIENILGPTISTVPLRVRLSRTENINSILRNVQSDIKNFLRYQHFGLQSIKKLSEHARLACDFDSLFVVQLDEQSAGICEFEGLDKVETVDEGLFHSHPINVECVFQQEKVKLLVHYSDQVLRPSQMRRLLEQFEHITGEVCKASLDNKSIAELQFVGSQDASLLLQWNSVDPQLLASKTTALAVIEKQTANNPTAVAIDAWDAKLTYKELWIKSMNLSSHLIKRGVAAGDTIPLIFERSSMSIVSMIACWHVGASFLALDPGIPSGRLETLLDAVKAKIVLVSQFQSTKFHSKVDKRLFVEAHKLCGAPAIHIEATPALLGHVAYVVFTSGSTGRPKGVVVDHRALATSLLGRAQAMGIDSKTRMLHQASYSFDASLDEIFLPLICGAYVCIPDVRTDLTSSLISFRVSFALLTPSVSRLVEIPRLIDLQKVALIGEPMTKDDFLRWNERSIVCLNAYGPAECAICSIVNPSVGNVDEIHIVGDPTSCRVWIVDADNPKQLMPIGCPGEMLIEGPILAQGYLEDETITELSFIRQPAWPFLPDAAVPRRFYRSGDLGLLTPDGKIVFLGRKSGDSQAKIRGQRFEKEEVENLIQRRLKQQALAIVEFFRSNAAEHLVVFICFEENGGIAFSSKPPSVCPLTVEANKVISEMKAYLCQHLPRFMVPVFYIPLTFIPLSPSGKRDTKTLRHIFDSLDTRTRYAYSIEEQVDSDPPEPGFETEIASLWSKILAIDNSSIRRNDSFFALGGDSLSAMKFVWAARTKGLGLTMEKVFDAKTLASMAAIVSTEPVSRPDAEPFSLVNNPEQLILESMNRWHIPEEDIEDIMPSTPLQHGLVALSLLNPVLYLNQEAFDISHVDKDTFKRAWSVVVGASPSLRTRFLEHNNKLYQVVVKEDIAWEESEDLNQLLSQHSQGLTRYVLLKGNGGRLYFVWMIHHALYDGWSRSLILESVLKAYQDEFVPVDHPFRNFVRYVNELDADAAQKFWVSELDATEPPGNFPAYPSDSYLPHGSELISYKIEKFSQTAENEFSVSTLLRAAWALVLSQQTNSTSVVFGATVNGRNVDIRGIENIIGLTMATIPVYIEVKPNQSIASFMRSIQEQNLRMMSWEQVGLQSIKRYTPGTRLASDFHSVLLVQPKSKKDQESSGNTIMKTTDLISSSGVMSYGLTLECFPGDGDCWLNAQYDPQVINTQHVRSILWQFEHVIHQLLDHGDSLVNTCDLLSAQEWDLLQSWTDENSAREWEMTVHTAFEIQAAKTPDSVAIDSWDLRLTYRELDSLSTRLAHRIIPFLRGHSEPIVPYVCDKSAWAYVIILAGICSTIQQLARLLTVSRDTRMLQFSAFVFDISIGEIFMTLFSGGTLVIPSPDDRISALPRVINEKEVNFAMVTRTVLALLQPSEIRRLNFLVFVGESPTADVVERWIDHVDNLVNGYGPAEATILATLHKFEKGERTVNARNIGKPVGCSVWLVDPNDHRKLVPTGSVGEIVIEGYQVATGYLNASEVDQNAFVANVSWCNIASRKVEEEVLPGRRIYKTGDLARFDLSTNEILFLGRKDTQVKIEGGFRVELGAVEQSITSCNDAMAAIVLVPSKGLYAGKLTALVSLAETHERRPGYSNFELVELSCDNSKLMQKIRDGVAASLPLYMVPRIWIFVQGIPQNASGKMDRTLARRWLDEIEEAMSESICRQNVTEIESSIANIGPQTKAQRILQEAVATVLKLPSSRILMSSSFTKQGGDSLTAMALIQHLRKQSYIITVRELLSQNQLASVEVLRSGPSKAPSSEAPFSMIESQDLTYLQTQIFPKLPTVVEDVYPCSPMQQGILLSHVRLPGCYQLRKVWALSSNMKPITSSTLAKAWQKVVAHHSALRTTFVEVHGRILQVVLGSAVKNFHIASENVSDLKPAALTQALGNLAPCHSMTFLCDLDDRVTHMVLDINHAVVDGYSFGVLLDDLSKAFGGDEENIVGSQYRRYIQHLSELNLGVALDYWTTHLSGIQETFLATDRNPVQKDPNEIRLDIQDITKLQDFGREHGITLPSMFTAAWAITLRCFTNQKDVCFGYLASGRDIPVDDIEFAVGAYANLLIQRVNFNQKETVIDVLQQVQDDYAHAVSNQHISLAEINHALNLTKTPFNTGISFENTNSVFSANSFLSFDLEASNGAIEFDGVMSIESETDESTSSRKNVSATFIYWSSAIPDQIANSLVKTYEKALACIVARHECDCSDLDLLEPSLAPSILQAASSRGYVNNDEDIRILIYRQSITTPESPAVVGWDGQLNYKELLDYVDRLAFHLRHRIKLPCGSVIALCFEKSRFAVVAILACLFSGFTFVPMDSSIPERRLQSIIQAAGVKFVLASSSQIPLALPGDVAVLEICEDTFHHLPSSEHLDVLAPVPKTLAYIIFTSGSTGNPKGVNIPYSALNISVLSRGTMMGFKPTSRVLQFASYAFDVAIDEIISTLVYGGCVCVPSENDRFGNLVGFINKYDVNFVMLTPTVAASIDVAALKKPLEVLGLGGERSSAAEVARWQSSTRRLDILYGPSECTIVTCVLQSICNPDKVGQIGKSIPGVSCWIVDPLDIEMRKPLGAIGELLIEGEVVAEGYLNDDHATSIAFPRIPQWLRELRGSQNEPKIYRTGDLCQICDAEGTLEFLGRKDESQIKIHGQRVESSEIEHHITQALSVLIPTCNFLVGAGLVTLESETRQRLTAFISPTTKLATLEQSVETQSHGLGTAKERSFITQKLKLALRSSLPSYMVPTAFIFLNQMPMTTSTKVDWKALKQIATATPYMDELDFELGPKLFPPTPQDDRLLASIWPSLPQTPDEKLLASVWGELLNRDATTFSRHDDFIDVGGDSILIMRMAAALRSFERAISVHGVFQNPKLADMAMHLRKLEPEEGKRIDPCYKPFSLMQGDHAMSDLLSVASNLVGTNPQNIEDILPTTPFQALAISHSMTVAGRGYETFFEIDIKGTLSNMQLWQACTSLVAKHPILRTAFVIHGQQMIQVVLKELIFEQIVKEYTTSGDIDQMTADIITAKRSEAPKPVPTEFFLIRDCGKEDFNRLVIRWNHAQYDGLSFPTLMRDLQNGYDKTTAISPPCSNQSFAHFVAYTQNRSYQAECEQYWRPVLEGSFPTEIVPRPQNTFPPTANTRVSRSVGIPPTHGFTIATIVKSAWALTLAKFTGKKDITFGQVVSGRDISMDQIDEIVGPCIDYCPVRINVENKSTNEILEFLQEQHVSILPYEAMGLSRLVRECTSWENFVTFPTIVQHQNLDQPLTEFELGDGLNCKLRVSSEFVGAADVFLFSHLVGSVLRLELSYSKDLVEESIAETLLGLTVDNINRLGGGRV